MLHVATDFLFQSGSYVMFHIETNILSISQSGSYVMFHVETDSLSQSGSYVMLHVEQISSPNHDVMLCFVLNKYSLPIRKLCDVTC